MGFIRVKPGDGKENLKQGFPLAKAGPGLKITPNTNDASNGLIVMNIEPMMLERQRLADGGMTPEERALRQQWVEDQYLTEREPVRVPGLIYRNSIKRFYGYPYDMLAKQVMKLVGPRNGLLFRFWLGKGTIAFGSLVGLCYYFRHHASHWEHANNGWRIQKERKPVFPGDPDWGKVLQTRPEEWPVNKGFYERNVFCDPTKYVTSTQTASDITGKAGYAC